jgi:hypothetical protein
VQQRIAGFRIEARRSIWRMRDPLLRESEWPERNRQAVFGALARNAIWMLLGSQSGPLR